jgi:hypothetical protein
MGVESNLHPHFLFTNLTLFSLHPPDFPICHYIVTFAPHPIAQNKRRDLHPDQLR